MILPTTNGTPSNETLAIKRQTVPHIIYVDSALARDFNRLKSILDEMFFAASNGETGFSFFLI